MPFTNNFDINSYRIDTMCRMCNQNEIDTSNDSASLLCNDCREKCLKLSVPAWIKGFAAAILVLTIFTSVQVPGIIDNYKIYLAAEQYAKEKYFKPAMDSYLSVLEKNGNNISIIMDAVDSAIGAQNFDTAAYIIDTYLVGKELYDKQYTRAVRIRDFLKKYYNTLDLCSEIFEKNADDVEGINNALLEIIERTDIDQTYVYFLLGMTTQDKEMRKEYLFQSTQQDERCTYTYAFYGNELRREGNYEKALEIYNYALSRNGSDTYAMRGIGIVMQIEGDIAGGLQKIRDAYEMNPDEVYINESIIVALCENAQRDEAMKILEEKSLAGYVFEQDLYDYLDGRITMTEYYS